MLAKTNLNSIEVLICKTLTDSYVSLDEFVSTNNMLNVYDGLKKEIKNSISMKWIFIVLHI